ncbi:flagellar basal body rod modification protein [Lamprobacter modestohalophilus]|uniref:Basal-body rod modification protein FlgD n=1 Tax=Lamprobacter modestohalophilus TaxID=1064514 RepID=A0A9X1B3V0_9GAMM|nr:flagellar hook assembly protein FlgD [Lamprobacter modestohalophilus]MBK1618374.1 flagellar basal body rod modification protein [Lamprobacter modestohalophilus]
MITGVDNARAANAGSSMPLSKSQSDELRESFLLLLTTQLQNQDPMNPLENSEMTSQIAQINMVSGIEQLNQTLLAITGQIDTNRALQASALIGKGVLVPGNKVMLEQGEEGDLFTTPFGIELARPAENVAVTIRGADGAVISQFNTGPVDAGVSSFQWDGLTNEGDPAASGAYTFSLEAIDADDEAVASEALNYASVVGVTPQDANGQVSLDLGAVYGQVGLDAVRQIL